MADVIQAPIRTVFADQSGRAPAGVSWPWIKFFQDVAKALFINFGTITGIGTGAAANMQAPAKGGGTGPANPALTVKWVEVDVGGVKYFAPLFQ